MADKEIIQKLKNKKNKIIRMLNNNKNSYEKSRMERTRPVAKHSWMEIREEEISFFNDCFNNYIVCVNSKIGYLEAEGLKHITKNDSDHLYSVYNNGLLASRRLLAKNKHMSEKLAISMATNETDDIILYYLFKYQSKKYPNIVSLFRNKVNKNTVKLNNFIARGCDDNNLLAKAKMFV